MINKKGNFIGIGVGVGDSENITIKAIKKLSEVDTVILPEAKKFLIHIFLWMGFVGYLKWAH